MNERDTEVMWFCCSALSTLDVDPDLHDVIKYTPMEIFTHDPDFKDKPYKEILANLEFISLPYEIAWGSLYFTEGGILVTHKSYSEKYINIYVPDFIETLKENIRFVKSKYTKKSTNRKR